MNRRDSIKLLTAATGGIFAGIKPFESFAAPLPEKQEGPRKGDFETRLDAYPSAPAFTWLRFGEVKPRGWIKEQMLRDLHTGYAGSLDRLCPDAGSDVFASGQSSSRVVTTGWRPHPAWWFGESEGNWRAGWIMLACLSEDPATLRKVEAYVQHVLAAQAPDGYIGVFAANLRYKSPGDMWSQACLLRGLLAYAECSRDDRTFNAILRAADAIIRAHAASGFHFNWAQSHDLMICDVLERLYDLTGDVKYRDFGVHCFEEWSAVAHSNPNQGDDDISLGALLDPYHLYYLGHSVHTVEHIRVPVWLAMATGRSDYATAARNAIARTGPYSFSTGSIVGNGVGGTPTHRYCESINNSLPDPYEGEWEYCTARETQVTFTSALQKTGNAAYAERTERVFFNAAQGGRLPDGSALTYFTPENRSCCDGRTQDGHEPEPRNMFSPTSKTVAVCCNPNGTQVSSHFVRGMWMRHHDGGLAALLYGPCSVSTEVAGVRVSLEEQTDYPFGNAITLTVDPEREAEFNLYFRNPAWSPAASVNCEGAKVTRDGDFWRVTKRWRAGDMVHLDFRTEIKKVVASNQEIALQYGALLFALPIAAVPTTVRTYDVPGFQDTYFNPAHKEQADLAFPASAAKKTGFTVVREKTTAASLRPFDASPVKLRGTMIDLADKKPVDVELVPFGCTTLRRLTFPLKGDDA